MRALMKEPEECSSGMRLQSTLLPAPAASMDQLKRWQHDSALQETSGFLPLSYFAGP